MPFFKKLSLILLGAFAFLCISIVTLFWVIDPNRYKSRIEAFAESRANLSLTINGNLTWTLYPWLGITLEETQISALNDSENPIASVRQLALSLKLIPLIKGDIEIDQLQVDGLDLAIITYPDGSRNTDQFFSSKIEESSSLINQENLDKNRQSSPASKKSRELNIHTIRFINSQFHIENQATQHLITGNQIDFSIYNIYRNNHLLFMDSMQFQRGDIAITQQNHPQSFHYQDINFDLNNLSVTQEVVASKKFLKSHLQHFQLRGGELQLINLEQQHLLHPHLIEAQNIFYSTAPATKSPWSLEKLHIQNLSLQSQTHENDPALLINLFNLTALNLTPSSEGSLQWRLSAQKEHVFELQLSGQSQISTDQVLSTWHLNNSQIEGDISKLPYFNLDKTLRLQFQGNAELSIVEDYLRILPLSLQIDDNRITGDISLSSIQKQQGVINLQADSLNLSSDLVATRDSSKNTRNHLQTKAPLEPSKSSQERALTINAELKKLTFDPLVAHNLLLKAHIQEELLRISEVKMALLGGNILGSGTLNIASHEPIIESHITINALPLTNLFTLLQKKIPLTGNLNLQGEFKTEGRKSTSFLNQLQGNFQANVTNGQLLGSNYEQLICEGFAFLSKKNFQQHNTPKTTTFKKLNGHATIKNGIINNQHLQIEIPGMSAIGNGNINLHKETLNYQINLLLKDSTGITNCKIDQYLKNISIPLHCQGSYVNASSSLCRLDQKALGTILANLAKTTIESTIKENLQDILPPALQPHKPKNRQEPRPKEIIKSFEGLFKR